MLEWSHTAPRSLETRPLADPLEEPLTSSQVVSFLERIESSTASLVIVVNDQTRSTATAATLQRLRQTFPGVLRRARLLVATGTHTFDAAERARHEEQLHLSACEISRVAWHDARSDALVDIDGVRVHPWLAEANDVLAIGSVEPHYFAGLTGAHKTLTIGCVARRDIEVNHARALDPASRLLVLEGNPVFDGIASMATAILRGRNVLAVNQVVHDGKIVCAIAGDPLATVRALRSVVIDLYASVLTRNYDVLHLRVPPPLGRSLYQADKALKNHEAAVRDGGTIILEASCEEGVGSSAFVEVLKEASSFASTVARITERGYRLGDHKAVRLRRLMDPSCRNVRVALVSPTMDARSLERTGIILHRSVDAVLHALEAGCTHGLRVEDAAMCASIDPEHDAHGETSSGAPLGRL